MKAIGIDLGTTNSLVAVVDNGKARALANESGETILPSVVRYEADGGITVGHEARAQATTYPETTLMSVKRPRGSNAGRSGIIWHPRLSTRAGWVCAPHRCWGQKSDANRGVR